MKTTIREKTAEWNKIEIPNVIDSQCLSFEIPKFTKIKQNGRNVLFGN